MTERWRKRLEHLDKESPSDEVFDRAHLGPRLPDAPVGMPSTSTRVVTAIAAFAVFALAISVFAIPVLRLRDQPGDEGQPLLPLWPVRTLDDVERAQVWLDGGEHPGGDLSMIKVPEFLLNPEGVATSFGKQVMAWDDPYVLELDAGWGVYAEPSLVSGGPISYPSSGNSIICLNPDTGEILDLKPCPYWDPDPVAPSDVVVGPGPLAGSPTSSPSASPFRKIAVYEFDPGLVDPGITSPWFEPAGVTLTLFQPLGTAEGNIWTVLDVEGSSVGMPLAAGSTVVAGEVIEIPSGWDEQQVAAGVHIGASEGCDVTTNDVEFRRQTIRLRVTVPEGSSCRGTVPGYVYAAVQLAAHIDLKDDPIANWPGEGLHALSAVPVMVRIPEAPSTVSPTPEPDVTPTPDDPTDEPTEPTTYTDPLGWSIEVPAGWSSQAFNEFNGRYTVSGAWFSSGDVDVLPGVAELPEQPVPADGQVMVKIWNRQGGPLDLPQDSSFATFMREALDRVAAGDPIDDSFVTVDGLTYSFRVQHGGGVPTQQQTDALGAMVASWSFEPWSEGETRQGWTAAARREGPAVSLFTDEMGAGYAIIREPQLVVLGAVPECEGGGRDSIGLEAGKLVVTCQDGTSATWTLDGTPIDSLPSTGPVDLLRVDVITSWDAWVLMPASLG